MEKFHKYCLSVLLVIICSNISAQANNGSTGVDHYTAFCEVYAKLFNSHDCQDSQNFSLKKKIIHFNAIHQKQKAVDLIEITHAKQKDFGSYYGKPDNGLAIERHDKTLENYKKDHEYDCIEALYLKNKVSKIRNKDYLDLIS